MVRKLQKTKAKTADVAPKAKTADVVPSTSVKITARKAKSEEKLSNGYNDNQNEAAQSKAEVSKSGSKVSDEKAETEIKTSETKVVELSKETDKISEEQENMEIDSKKEPVKQKKEDIKVSKEPKASQRTRKRKMATTVKDVKEKSNTVPKTKAKRQKVDLQIPKISSVSGKVFVIGQNDVGQLGLGENVTEKKRPALLELPYSFVDIAAGGMHSVCLTENGEIITFGCNDEGALGRITSEEGSEMIPDKIEIPECIIQVSAGDSHSAALSESGQVYIWGNFRNINGSMGLVTEGAKQCTPVKILNGVAVVKISSGSDHLVCLSREGVVYTCGCGDAGQLGRFTKHAVEHGDRKGRSCISAMLLPDEAPVGRPNKLDRVNNVWTGSYATFASVEESVYVFGLNNYGQLGIQVQEDEESIKFFKPMRVESLSRNRWSQISGGQHHTLTLEDSGKVHSLGRSEYGRLGLGESTDRKSEPTVIPLLEDTVCIDISSGNCASFAVADNGSVYTWGFGTNYQLGHGDDNDQHIPKLIEGNFFNSWQAFKIAGGGQHTLILANPRKSLEESQ